MHAFALRSRHLALTASLLLLGSFAASAAPRVDVSEDGNLVSRYDSAVAEAEAAHGAVHRGGSTVPYGALPDWTGDLERAVGGLEFGDFDNDGDLDLACGCYNASSSFPPITIYYTLIYRNDGGVLETTPSWTSTDQRHTGDVRFGDLDGDGRVDLYVSNGGQSLQPSVVYTNGPSGIDETPDWIADDETWSLAAQIADVDDDGRNDVVVSNQGNSIIPSRPASIFFNGPGGLETTPSWTSADSALSNGAAVADLDGSSDVTVIAHALSGDGSTRIFHLPQVPLVSVGRVEVIGGVTPAYTIDRRVSRIHFAAPPANGAAIEVDYTYSRYPDVAFARWVNYATCAYPNSAGTVGSLPSWNSGDASRADKGIGFSDVDGDGDPDLAFSGSDPTELWRNDGGTLAGAVWTPTNPNWSCQDLDWADIDNDGDEDLATIHFGSRQLRIYLNQGGVLDSAPSWVYSLGSSATEVAFGDVNGDGLLDVAAGTARLPLVLFLNQGGVVAAPATAPSAPGGAITATPNPSRRDVRLELPASPRPGIVRIVDAAGRLVRELPIAAGATRAGWDGRGSDGRSVPAGVYWAVREGDADRSAGRLIRLR
jgi:FG-GAP-like repeat